MRLYTAILLAVVIAGFTSTSNGFFIKGRKFNQKGTASAPTIPDLDVIIKPSNTQSPLPRMNLLEILNINELKPNENNSNLEFINIIKNVTKQQLSILSNIKKQRFALVRNLFNATTTLGTNLGQKIVEKGNQFVSRIGSTFSGFIPKNIRNYSRNVVANDDILAVNDAASTISAKSIQDQPGNLDNVFILIPMQSDETLPRSVSSSSSNSPALVQPLTAPIIISSVSPATAVQQPNLSNLRFESTAPTVATTNNEIPSVESTT